MGNTITSLPYGTDPWKIVEREFHPERIAASETLFALANGYLGMRGAFEERTFTYHPGTYINGIYETKPIVYGETAYGYAKLSQTILNLPDTAIVRLYVDGDLFDLSTGTVVSYLRELDMSRGVLFRALEWESPSGKRIRLESERLVSFTRRHVAALSWRCSTVGCEATLTIVTEMNGAVRNLVGFEDPRVGASFKGPVLRPLSRKLDGTAASMRYVTRNSRFTVVCASDDRIETGNRITVRTETDRHRVMNRYTVYALPDEPVALERFSAYCTSRDAAPARLSRLARKEVERAKTAGFETLRSEQRAYMERFWRRSDIAIEGDPLMSQSLRFNLFHLLQGSGTDGFTNAPAKGLTGEGYEGHYFWDSEIYVLPVFIYSHPDLARKMLEYRYRTLDRARERAAELSHRGALFPWRTIDGNEASAYYPAGTAQYHINADIVYAMKKYIEITGDASFLRDCAAETALETARFWISLGDWIPGRGFCFNTVTGPDEYSALVNNNVYTNLMAKMNLEFALGSLERLAREFPEDYARITAKTGLTAKETEEWARAAANIYLPFDRDRGIYCQDDSFLTRAPWRSDSGPAKHPLLLHYHPLNIYRYQVLKQPDLILAQFLLGNRFTAAEKKRCFDYYDPLITGDSSLAPCIQCVMSAELGYIDLAYRYFMKTARMDLDDINGNVRDGVHMAAMAGTWIALVCGFAGLRDHDGELSFNPRLPARWTRLSFRLTVRGSLLEIEIGKEAVRYTLLEGESLSFRHRYNEIALHAASGDGDGRGTPCDTVVVSLVPRLSAVLVDLDLVSDRNSDLRRRTISLLERFARASVDTVPVDGNGTNQGLEPDTGLDGLFAGRSGRRLCVKGFPDPEPFLNAAELHKVTPACCVVLTANPEAAKAAAAGGFFTAAIGFEPSGTGIRVDDLSELSPESLSRALTEAYGSGAMREAVPLGFE